MFWGVSVGFGFLGGGNGYWRDMAHAADGLCNMTHVSRRAERCGARSGWRRAEPLPLRRVA